MEPREGRLLCRSSPAWPHHLFHLCGMAEATGVAVSLPEDKHRFGAAEFIETEKPEPVRGV